MKSTKRTLSGEREGEEAAVEDRHESGVRWQEKRVNRWRKRRVEGKASMDITIEISIDGKIDIERKREKERERAREREIRHSTPSPHLQNLRALRATSTSLAVLTLWVGWSV